MKILLINPLAERGGLRFRVPRDALSGEAATSVLYPPIDLAWAAAYLRERDVDVDLLEACAFGMGTREVIAHAERSGPDAILIPSSRYTAYEDVELGIRIREHLPQCLLLISGNNATVNPGKYLDVFDGVVLGELESGLWNLISGERKENVAFRDERGRLVVRPRTLIQDLDSLPLPARDLLPNERYRTHYIRRNPFTWIFTQRGCPAPCEFCEIQTWGMGKVRYRSAESVLEELREVRNRYGIPYVMFRDGDFCSSRTHALEVCETIAREGLDLNWKCTARADKVDAELLSLMKRAGCELISYGFESASEESLARIRKGHGREVSERAARLTREAGIEVLGFFMLGVPGETQESAQQTIAFSKQLALDYAQFTTYLPLRDERDPQFYDVRADEGPLAGPAHTPLGPGLDGPQLLSLTSRAYLGFYARPSYIWRRIRRLRDPKDLWMKLRAVFELVIFAILRGRHLRRCLRENPRPALRGGIQDSGVAFP